MKGEFYQGGQDEDLLRLERGGGGGGWGGGAGLRNTSEIIQKYSRVTKTTI